MVSYADFMTLLFALFVVLFASSYHDKKTIQRVSTAVKNGFQEMGTFSGSDSAADNSRIIESQRAPGKRGRARFLGTPASTLPSCKGNSQRRSARRLSGRRLSCE